MLDLIHLDTTKLIHLKSVRIDMSAYGVISDKNDYFLYKGFLLDILNSDEKLTISGFYYNYKGVSMMSDVNFVLRIEYNKNMVNFDWYDELEKILNNITPDVFSMAESKTMTADVSKLYHTKLRKEKIKIILSL